MVFAKQTRGGEWKEADNNDMRVSIDDYAQMEY